VEIFKDAIDNLPTIVFIFIVIPVGMYFLSTMKSKDNDKK
jgi:hypothetical protein